MRLETYEDLVALSPAEAITLGYAGDSEGVRAERAQTAQMLLDNSGGRQRTPQVQIAETVWRNQGSLAGALHEMERAGESYERWARGDETARPLTAPLSHEQVRELREQVIPRPEPMSRDALSVMEDEVADVERQERIGRDTDSWEKVAQAARWASAFEDRHHMSVAASSHAVEAEPFLRPDRFAGATAAEAGQAWHHARARSSGRIERLSRAAGRAAWSERRIRARQSRGQPHAPHAGGGPAQR